MLDIETTHKLASFLEAKLSLKNTTEIPRPVHGPLQYPSDGFTTDVGKRTTAPGSVFSSRPPGYALLSALIATQG